MANTTLDREEWRSFFKLLGKDTKQVRLRSFYPKGHPLKAQDRGAKMSTSNGAEAVEWIQKNQDAGKGVYFVVNDGGDTDSEITNCRAFFVEWDDRDKDEQVSLWRELGLPEPSIQIDTGGKSIHNYWVLKRGCDVKTWRQIQERLLDYADADRALKNPSRVMRLPGTFHMNDKGKGDKTSMIHQSETRYNLTDIERCLPTKKDALKVKEALSFKQYEPLPFEQIQKALFCIPPRKPGTGTYFIYRNLLWGLIKACLESGKTKDDAVSLMKTHSPDWTDVQQIADSGGQAITAASFWYFAKDNGFQIPKVMKMQDPNDPSKELTITVDRLQTYQANELLADLEKVPPTSMESLRYNEYTQQIQKGYGEDAVICEGENSIERFYLTLAKLGKKISKDVAIDCAVQVARQRPYNPVKEYLLTVAHRETPIDIDRLASQFLRPEDSKYNESTMYDEMLKKTLIAAVYRAFRPGYKWDNALIIVGPQGARKSSFFQALAGEFFSDSLKDIHGKDAYQIINSAWIHEWSELESITNKKAASDIKAFLSQSTDMYRVPYGKVTERFKRRSIIVGTSNSTDGVLQDETGNRRFLIIPTSHTMFDPIDIDELNKQRDRIWCSAYNCFKNEETLQLKQEFQQQINIENEKYLIDSPWKSVIKSYTENPQNYGRELSTEEVLTLAIEKPVERQNRYDQMQVSLILKQLGYRKIRKTIQGSRKWVYIRDSID